MRDALFHQLTSEIGLVVTADCSGGIGIKDDDVVKVEDEIVGYYAARVSLMENISVGGTPFSLVFHNLSGENSWVDYEKGVTRALSELGINKLPIIGSSETNFKLRQSGFGISVLGQASKKQKTTPKDASFALVGSPLVGIEVLLEEEKVLPLQLFHSMVSLEGIYEIIPIGSKGVMYEFVKNEQTKA